MPRHARKLSESGYMHLIFRSIAKQIMFEEAADYQRFLSSLERFCGETEVKICAYCLMENHVHLLVCDLKGHTPLMIKKLDVSYSQSFMELSLVRSLPGWQAQYKAFINAVNEDL